MDYDFATAKLYHVLIADDDPMVREAYHVSLIRHDNYEVVDETRGGWEAVETYEELKPDVVLMDLQMPDISGIDAIRKINREHRGVCIVVLTTFGTREYTVSALRTGASGYLIKDCGGPTLLTGIQQARGGEMPLAPGVHRELVADLLVNRPKILTDEAAVIGLAPRGEELPIWLGQGMTSIQIATKIFASKGSVK